MSDSKLIHIYHLTSGVPGVRLTTRHAFSEVRGKGEGVHASKDSPAIKTSAVPASRLESRSCCLPEAFSQEKAALNEVVDLRRQAEILYVGCVSRELNVLIWLARSRQVPARKREEP